MEHICSGVGGLFVDGHGWIGTGFITDIIPVEEPNVMVEIFSACESTGVNPYLPFSIGFVKEESEYKKADGNNKNGKNKSDNKVGTMEFVLPLVLLNKKF